MYKMKAVVYGCTDWFKVTLLENDTISTFFLHVISNFCLMSPDVFRH